MINLRRNREWNLHVEAVVAVVVFAACILLLGLWYSDVVALWLWTKGW